MSYGDDFASVDTAGAPLDPTIMIGADPMVWGAIGLGLVVAGLVGLADRPTARGRSGTTPPTPSGKPSTTPPRPP
ncbi:MAG: hypothetical protein KL785_02375 [Brevundimonas sp.]|nr:hypothetical protein [Brevundimonas sp.]